MDTLSHALWGRGFYGYRGGAYLSFFCGAMPDLFSFGVYFLISLLIDGSSFEYGRPNIQDLPSYVFILYNITHSLITASFFIYLVFKYFGKKYSFAMLAWPLHIILDFPFHTAEFFPTPILWPIIEVRFDGISWSNPYIWFSNITGILILYLYRYVYSR